MSGFSGDGIVIQSSTDSVQSCYIGTNAAGTAALANGNDGIEIEAGSSGNTIGGFTATPGTGPGNLLSGNVNDGVEITGAGATGNVVWGNLAGLDVTGTVAIANQNAGVGIDLGASSNTIGGTVAGLRNVLSGNADDGFSRGVIIADSGTNFNLVIGNYIGTNAAGSAAVANDNCGVLLQSGPQSNTIGGPAAGDRNLISGNLLAGVAFQYAGTTGNVVEGNWIGLNAAGTGTITNLVGVAFADSASGNSAIANVASGNLEAGIAIVPFDTSSGSDANLVQGNLIGTDPTGTIALGNTGPGVAIYGGSSNNTIGGTTTNTRNIISANASAGVSISGTGTSGNLLLGNYIGTGVAGAGALANSGAGVIINSGATSNTIGGSIAGAGNVVSGNSGDGIHISGAGSNGNLIAGNLVGTNAAGTVALGNTAFGILIDSGASSNTVGGNAASFGNVVSGNLSNGIEMMGSGTTDNVVYSNLAGLNAAGTAAVGNAIDGISIDNGASSNTVKSNEAAGNTQVGIAVEGSGTSDNTVVQNLVGVVSIAGTLTAIPNSSGINLQTGAIDNTIGGSSLAQANIIAGNSSSGIDIGDSGTADNVVEFNYIGTDSTNDTGLGDKIGVFFFGDATSGPESNTIGPGNIISGNTSFGIWILNPGTSDNVVLGDLIGTNSAGTAALPNGIGVAIGGSATGNTIGGTSPADANLISGNTGVGVQIGGYGTIDNVVAGNKIGISSSGACATE